MAARKGETELGKAIRVRDARMKSAWTDYPRAILAARDGTFDSLVQLFAARRPLDDSDFDSLAEFIAEIGRGRGQQASQPAHKVAQLALALKDVAGIPMCDQLIDLACKLEGQFGGPIESENVRESVWTLIRNPKRLR